MRDEKQENRKMKELVKDLFCYTLHKYYSYTLKKGERIYEQEKPQKQ